MAEIQMGDELRAKYPANTNYQLSGNAPKPEKVVKGTVTKKQSLGRKLADTFIGADIFDVKTFLIWDCLIPAVKYAFLDSILMLFGERGYRGGRGTARPGVSTYTNYGQYSSLRDGPVNGPAARRGAGLRFDASDLKFETRQDAEQVIDILIDFISEYGVATVANFYDASGVTGDGFTDNKFGWKDLSQATTRRVRDGWICVMPKVIALA